MLKNFIAAFLLVSSALAADNALLRNGFAIRHQKRELLDAGSTTRLYLSTLNSDFVDVRTADIERFEPIPEEIAPVPAIPAPAPATLADIVRAASDKTLIDEDLLMSVIRAESGAHSLAVSRKGAQGLMQLMPGTARQLGVKNAFDPRDNVEGGSRYLHHLLIAFHFDLAKALAAYNAGPDTVIKYKGVPPYPETRAYVARIIKDYNRAKLAQSASRRLTAKTSPARPSSKS